MDDLSFCIRYLTEKSGKKFDLPPEKALRALMNVTMPVDLSDEFYARQDNVLRGFSERKTIVDVDELPEVMPGVSLFRGDITRLKADAIVNAANGRMLGCLAPLHACIDNAIHSFAGLQVRRDMMEIMKKQGHDEPAGRVKVTKGYNLPAKYIFHTVGPIAGGYPRREHEVALTSCYLSCLNKAVEMGLKNIVFCSVSTGVYGYPIEKASRVAVRTVCEFLKKNDGLHVVFDVFSEGDLAVYKTVTSSFR